MEEEKYVFSFTREKTRSRRRESEREVLHGNNPEKTKSGHILSSFLQLIYFVVSLLLQADFYCISNVGVGSFSVSVTNVFGKN